MVKSSSSSARAGPETSIGSSFAVSSAPVDVGVEIEEGEVVPETLGQQGKSFGEKAVEFWQKKNEVNRSAEAGIDLSFNAVALGAERVHIPVESWASLAADWEWSLVGIVFGSKPLLGRMQSFIKVKWGGNFAIQVSQLKPGIFLFKFSFGLDRDRILDLGPWTFDNRPLVLKHWSPDENYSLESVASLPVWVRFAGLAPHLRRADTLSLIASTVGRLLRIDGFTARNEKLMYARVLIEVFATNEFKKSVVIEGPNGVNFFQKIMYEWTPPRCSHYQSFGHSIQMCRLPRISMEDGEDENDKVLLEPGVDGLSEEEGDFCKNPQGETRAPTPPFEPRQGAVQKAEACKAPPHAGEVHSSVALFKENNKETGESSGAREEVAVTSTEQPFIEVKKKSHKKKRAKSSSEDSSPNLNLIKLSQRLKGNGKSKGGASKVKISV
ncbi:hypothetical protein QQ045_002752 [Rhodiola kirilowii]